MTRLSVILILILNLLVLPLHAGDTFTPYQTAEAVPRTAVDLWKGYDARKESLDVRVVKEWKTDGVVTRYVTFRVGTFKGADARLAAYYSFPDDGKKHAAFVWSHGGGQRADRNRGVYFAKQGFATVDINWLGRPMEEDIEINTDWGKVDPTQGPRFYAKALRNGWKRDLQPDEHSIDPVPSPRNANWFLLTVAARRAITFLERQPEVDAGRIGFSGFSMGGMITALVAVDPRLKAVAPFVGGTGFKYVDFPGGIAGSSIGAHFTDLELYKSTIDASAYWPMVKCPTVFITSSNDFHSTFERIYQSMALVKHGDWRVTGNIHRNHGPGPEQWAVLNLWFEQYLKGRDQAIPPTPPSTLNVTGKTARFTVTPADGDRLLGTEIYYSYDPNSRTRFWERAEAARSGASWTADLAVHDNLPLYVFAICRYRLPNKMTLERGETRTFTLNSIEQTVVPEKVDLSTLTKLAKPGAVVEDFRNGIQDWSSRDGRTLRTYKFQSPNLDRSNDKQLALTIDPQGRRLSLRLSAGSKFLSRENNLGNFSFTRRVEGDGAKVIRIGRDEFKGDDGKTLEWSKVATFDVMIMDEATKTKLDLTSPEGLKVLRRIELIEAAAAPPPPGPSTASPPKPNVVLILTDDLGWQDVKCYDVDAPSPMETPRIDALAKRGVQFWQAYAPAPTCAPTRCAILSGIHPARAQKTHVVGGAPPAPHHLRAWSMMAPWYSGRMPEDTYTLARALKSAGYATGHSGKWHVAINHNAFPQPKDVGFDWTRHDRGTAVPMRPHRMAGFSTRNANDPHRLDEKGFPRDQTTEDAMTFLRENKDRPFFLYYATWLVHTPIHTRSKALLEKYVKKLGVELSADPSQKWMGEGQTNPFYCAMVEQLDHYVGQIFDYLEQTDDPRRPGHKLVENTYIIFTSDNGGMEGSRTQIITDNYPLDRGKISLMEGGTRVPLIITGPGIPAGVESDVMVNGLDFYPTILSLTGTVQPQDKHLDGLDLAPLLKQDPTDPGLVRDADDNVRDTMVWHFPNSAALESSIRIGDYKLVRNYDHANNPNTRELELYRLYDSAGDRTERADIEEKKNLADAMPGKARELNRRLSEILTEMEASYPYYNPHAHRAPATRKNVCTVLSHRQTADTAEFTYRENGAKVVRANLIYTRNGGARYEEWFRTPARLVGDSKVVAQLPKGTTHYFLNLIDENNFLRSHPEILEPEQPSRAAVKKYSTKALRALTAGRGSEGRSDP